MELILSYGADGTIFATSLRGNQLVRQWHGISCCREGLCTVRSNTFLSGDHQLIVGINNKVFMWKWEQENVATRSVIMSGQNENCSLSVMTTTTNGYYLVAGTTSGEVMVWDIESGSLLSVFKAHSQRVTALALSDDSLWLATGGADALIRVWSLPLVISATTQYTANPLSHSSECCWITFSAHSLPVTTLRWIDLSLLVSGSLDQTLRVWDVPSQRALLTVTFQTPLRCVTVSPNHDTLFIGAADGGIYVLSLWNLPSTDFTASSHTQRLTGHAAPLTTLCTSFDGSILVSGSEDGTLRLWDTCTFQVLQTITRHKSSVVSVHFLVVSPPLYATLTQNNRTSLSFPRPLSRWSSFDSTTHSQQLSPLIFSDLNTELVHSLWRQSSHSFLTFVHSQRHNLISYLPSPTTTTNKSQDNLQLENIRLKEKMRQLEEVIARWKKLGNELYSVCARVLPQQDRNSRSTSEKMDK